MIDEFNPPIKERETSELLEIVAAEKKWNPEAVNLAFSELRARKVDYKKIEHSKYLSNKKGRIKNSRKANEGYNIFDLIGEPFWTIVEILFSWELKKDGYLRKARQQKRMRFSILILIIIGLLYSALK
jgi:hypothetical protein